MGTKQMVGEIKLWPGLILPRDFLVCDGREVETRRFPKLFNVIGNTYGGVPGKTFKLPDMSGRVPMGSSDTHLLGAEHGAATASVDIDPASLPKPTGTINATIPESKVSVAIPASNTTNLAPTPNGNYLGKSNGSAGNIYSSTTDNSTLHPFDVTLPERQIQIDLGGDGGAAEMPPIEVSTVQPSLVLNYIIAYDGTYPW